jgi:hypothetical protein
MPKVTISIPEHVSEEAKKIAGEMNIPLDRLFTLAFYHYLSAYHGELLTEILDTVYTDEPSTIDPALLKLQSVSLGSKEW